MDSFWGKPSGNLGLVGKEGRRYPRYGIGQSLVLLPFDAISSATVAPALRRMGLGSEKQRQGPDVGTAFLMQWVFTSGVLALAYPSARWAAGLLFGTTCLQICAVRPGESSSASARFDGAVRHPAIARGRQRSVCWGVNAKRFLAGFLPPIALAVLIDRWYHRYRFGEWSGNYISVHTRDNFTTIGSKTQALVSVGTRRTTATFRWPKSQSAEPRRG